MRARSWSTLATGLVVAVAVATVAGACDGSSAAIDAGAIDVAAMRDAGTDAAPAEADADTPLDGGDADAAADAGARFDGGTRYGTPAALGTLAAVLPETSGIAASRTHPGVFWLENDSGNPADIFAVDRSATLLATIHLMGAMNTDWEDLSIHEGAAGDELYVPDIGDNLARMTNGVMGRAGIRVYRLAEPDASLGDATIAPERFDFQYPDRPYDCEAFFVDHRTGDLYFVTKEAPPAEIFVARAPLDSSATTTLEHVGTMDFDTATAADMSRDSARIVVRGYGSIQVYPLGSDGDVAASLTSSFITAMPAAAAEAIAFEPDGYGLYTVPEGVGATLFFIPSE